MNDLAMIWMSTIAMIVVTAFAFVVLAEWSAGGPAPWSILPGLAQGVSDWVRSADEVDWLGRISPRAEEPGPPLNTGASSPGPPWADPGELEARVEEHVDPELQAEVEMEEVHRRRV